MASYVRDRIRQRTIRYEASPLTTVVTITVTFNRTWSRDIIPGGVRPNGLA